MKGVRGKMSKKGQKEKIIEFLDLHGSITQRDANRFGCMRLASRICELRQKGIEIDTLDKVVTNADGSKSTVAEYRYHG